jgi:hypothetical protein
MQLMERKLCVYAFKKQKEAWKIKVKSQKGYSELNERESYALLIVTGLQTAYRDIFKCTHSSEPNKLRFLNVRYVS